MGQILLTYAAYLSFPLIIAGVLLLVALITKKGSVALIIGITSYFAIYILITQISNLFLGSWGPVPSIVSCINPSIALSAYFSPYYLRPTLTQVYMFIGISYVIVIAIFALGYYYFSRRLNT
jgi:hypothetical protein